MRADSNRATSTNIYKLPRLSGLLAERSTRSMWLVAIVLLAIVLRLLSALFQGNSVEPLPGIHDQVSYDALARRVIEGHGFSFATDHWPATRANEPTAHWSYLYTLYISATYLVSGAQPLVARLLQAVVVGLLHTWLVWRIGKHIFGPTTGVVAALLSAGYLYFVYYAGALITEPFYIVGILWTLDAALRLAAREPIEPSTRQRASFRWRLWAELGLAAGVTILLRQLFLLFIPFLLLWLWWSSELLNRISSSNAGASKRAPVVKRSHILAGATLSMLIMAAMIAPWSVRNYFAFQQFVPLNTNSGYAFYWGNHPHYGTSFPGILPDDGPSYFDLLPRELLELNEAQLDQALLKLAVGFVVDDPVRYLRLSLSRATEYFKFWPAADSSAISNIARVSSFGLALPFILYGLWRSALLFRLPNNSEQRMAIVLLYLFAAVYTMIHLMVWTLIRYRLPVDSVLLVFAALGLVALTHGFAMKYGWNRERQWV
jgi:hypothetical protein